MRFDARGRLVRGLWTLSAGLGLGLTAIVLFLVADQQTGEDLYAWREAALVLASASLMTFLFGLHWALPSTRRLRQIAVAGLAVCAAATAMFAVHYPDHFNVASDPDKRDFTALDAGLYAVGLAAIMAGNVTGLIAHYLKPEDDEPFVGEDGKATWEVPDWVVEQDLADAMERHGVSWGLGDAGPDSSLDVAPAVPAGAVFHDGRVNEVHVSSRRGDDALARLVQMRPGRRDRAEAESADVDDPTAALVAFRKQVAAEPRRFRPKRRFWQRRRAAGPQLGQQASDHGR